MKIEKTKIDGVVVVEGKSDVAFLGEFIDAIFVTTNGSEVSKETIEYVRELKKKYNVIVLTDPDSPGERIRTILNDNIDGLENAYVDKSVSIKHHKVGVAESTKEEVLKALSYRITYKQNPIGHITLANLYDLGLVGQDNSENMREKVLKELHLGYCSTSKTFLKRINNIDISIEKIHMLIGGK